MLVLLELALPAIVNVVLLWLAAIAITLLVLHFIFPRLQRQAEDDSAHPAAPGGLQQRAQIGRRTDLAPIVVEESRDVARLSEVERACYWRRNLLFIAGLLAVWFSCSLLPSILAPLLNRASILTGFPLGYYMGAQGSLLVFIALTLGYAWLMVRLDQRFGGGRDGTNPALRARLVRRALAFGLSLLALTSLLVVLELSFALSTPIIGWSFIALTLGVYAVIGTRSRAQTLDEYYVAARRVPALFNGLAIAADWMSAATFISLAGYLWLLGYEGLAYIMGWTGGYVLLALLLAPYLRKFGQYTIPDLIGARFRSNLARVTAAIMSLIISFTYLTAQVTGVGIIMSRFLGVRFILGVAIGLAAVLFCSYLGGMRAVTWTQVAQGIILIVAYLVPVTWLALRATGVPLPQLVYGEALQNIERLETVQGTARSYLEPFNDWSAWNFLALTICLMCGTAGLPHILTRFYTVPTVRQARRSVSWALVFIVLIYLTIPAYAAFSRWEMLELVGKPIGTLPRWAINWANAGLLEISDANGDSLLQLAELRIDPDLIVLATPEIVGLPHTIGALVAAGGLAAALSTADGLLMVITSAVAHDIYYNALNRRASAATRLRVGRVVLLIAATLAGLTALRRLGIIVELVAWAFSLGAATIFPTLVLGIFWKRTNKNGAVAGMVSGLLVTLAYIVINRIEPDFNILGITSPAAGIFGIIVNFVVMISVSSLTPPPPREAQLLVDALRRP